MIEAVFCSPVFRFELDGHGIARLLLVLAFTNLPGNVSELLNGFL